MLATLNSTSSRVSWTLRGLIAAGGLAVLALPVVYFSSTGGLLADDADPTKPKAAATAAKEPAIEFLPAPSPAEEKILAALEEPTAMEFAETPLQTVVHILSDYHGIQIQLDDRSLEDAAIGADTPMDCSVNGVKLKSGLRLLLRNKGLAFIILDEVLLITTPERAATELLTRTYPVGDLIEDEDYDALIETITTTVKPQSWDEVGGAGSVSEVPISKCLVISQTRELHDEVLELLRALRAARKVSAD